VPEYVSVLAFDDFAWTSNFAPQLTAVAQPSHEMGRRAVQLLLSTMESETELTEKLGETAVVLKAELRVRQSTAPPRR
jgi:DNA-binding LacI/PurR family transcriptional regulator